LPPAAGTDAGGHGHAKHPELEQTKYVKQGRIKANLTLDGWPKTLYTSGIEMFFSRLTKQT
jgi:hypothetical protein